MLSINRGATEIGIQCSDADAVVLALHNYSLLCQRTSMLLGTGQKGRLINLASICHFLQTDLIKWLLAFHAISHCD